MTFFYISSLDLFFLSILATFLKTLLRKCFSRPLKQSGCPVGWSCRIYRLHLGRGVKKKLNEYPVYDTKQSDDEVLAMLELWGMQSTPSLPSLPDPLWLGVVAPDRVLSMGQIELKCVLMLN